MGDLKTWSYRVVSHEAVGVYRASSVESAIELHKALYTQDDVIGVYRMYLD